MVEKSITIPAASESLPEVYGLIEGELEKIEDCGRSDILQLHMVVDEVFANIMNYAYEGKEGMATITFAYDSNTKAVTITFIDEGVPFDPLSAGEPDVTLEAGKRTPGGLGLFMVKSAVDEISHEYRDGKNISMFKKTLKGKAKEKK